VLDDQVISLKIYDTAGQERFRSIGRAYYRGADGIILVYDVTNLQSFENIKAWDEELKAYAKAKACILLGNKSDLLDKRAVTVEQGKKLASKLGYIFLETSAKTASNVEEAVITLARNIREKTNPPNSLQKSDSISIKVSNYVAISQPTNKNVLGCGVRGCAC